MSSSSTHDHRKGSDGSISDKLKISAKPSERHDSSRKTDIPTSLHQHRKSDADKTLCHEALEKNAQAGIASSLFFSSIVLRPIWVACGGDPSVRVSTEFAGVTIFLRSAMPSKSSDSSGKNGGHGARRRSEFQQASLPVQYRTDPSSRHHSLRREDDHHDLTCLFFCI